ncbi:hypothetical protein SI859A1_01170 [Aurantimonas manganoxydans SI85-9A1]|uniref:Uncharacterized protein n=1 Tax=Aurantimonas manganoxydans (strain ATCC BAA-1229 / DSM 21871 / SI85-9A1) TaxID=287752 RepID=Q1YEA5_AURMS|nr:hypothetical protein SI859A1_01170 [Aurantimonas manganoxydans SI85-9A1]
MAGVPPLVADIRPGERPGGETLCRTRCRFRAGPIDGLIAYGDRHRQGEPDGDHGETSGVAACRKRGSSRSSSAGRIGWRLDRHRGCLAPSAGPPAHRRCRRPGRVPYRPGGAAPACRRPPARSHRRRGGG